MAVSWSRGFMAGLALPGDDEGKEEEEEEEEKRVVVEEEGV